MLPGRRYIMTFKDIISDNLLNGFSGADITVAEIMTTLGITFLIAMYLFFVYRFKDDRRPYQLIFAIAIPLSLAIWLSDKRTLFYIIGLLELLLIIAALVTAIVFRTPAADEADDDDESEDDNEEEAPADEKPADDKPADEVPAEEASAEVKNEVEE